MSATSRTQANTACVSVPSGHTTGPVGPTSLASLIAFLLGERTVYMIGAVINIAGCTDFGPVPERTSEGLECLADDRKVSTQ